MRGHRGSGGPVRLQIFRGLSHHTAERDSGIFRPAAAGSRRPFRTGQERTRIREHGLRSGVHRNQSHDILFQLRHQPEKRRRQLLRIGEDPHGLLQHFQRRPGHRVHSAFPAGLRPGDAGVRQRRIPHDGLRAGRRAGSSGHDLCCF